MYLSSNMYTLSSIDSTNLSFRGRYTDLIDDALDLKVLLFGVCPTGFGGEHIDRVNFAVAS